MKVGSNACRGMTVAAAVAFAIAASSARAQQQQDSDATAPAAGGAAAGGAAAAGAAGSSEALQEVIVTGTRTEGMQAAASPAPIQILSPQALQVASGNPQLMDTLARLVPSLSIEAFGFDQAGNTLMARLRGLSPNDVLILVNGKRRHTTANLAVDGGSTFQGGANVDLNFIPLDAIDHIEVLTDGAAAQYGSDAIAGVINIILKDKSSGGSVTGSASHYFDDQGPSGDVSGNFGFEPYDGAFFNVTAMVHNHGHTFKSGPEPQAINDIGTYPDSLMLEMNGYPYLNPIEGDGEQHTKLGMINAGFPFADNAATAYLTASYGYKESNSYENYRDPTHVSCSTAACEASNMGNPLLLGQVMPEYVYGFLPQEEIKERDYQVNTGFKGVAAGWNWDLGYGYGQDHVDMYTINTVGLSFELTGLPTPTSFYDGFLESTQSVTTLDINRDFEVGMAGPLNVAFGAEYRHEFYTIGAGIPESYVDGGASSFPGFTPANAGSNDRKNESFYIDLAGKPVDKLTVDLAGRHEHYSDFGSANVGKLTARYDFIPEFALRGTISNGFRAPTLAEEFYSATNVAPTSASVQLPPNSPGGKFLLGGNGLQAEKSTNYSVGFVFRPIPRMSMTLDLYRIDLNNRIKGTQGFLSQIAGAPPTGISVTTRDAITKAIALNGNVIDPSVLATGTVGVTLFANGIDTVTQGADLVFNFPDDYSWGHVNWQISGAYNDTYISKLPPAPKILTGYTLYSLNDTSVLTSSNPRFQINLGGYWSLDKWSVNLTEHVIGPSSQYINDGGLVTGTPIYYNTTLNTAWITDLSIGFKATKNVQLTIGANNLFNKFPEHLNPAIVSAYFHADYSTGIQIQPIWSPYGINGGLYYGRVTLSW